MGLKLVAVALAMALGVVTAVGWTGASASAPRVAEGTQPVKRVNLKYEFIAGFRPSSITIVKGTKVIFRNVDIVDDIHHTVTKNKTNGGPGKFWDSGDLEPGKAFTRTFNRIGTFNYICSYHDHMRGKITVVAPTP